MYLYTFSSLCSFLTTFFIILGSVWSLHYGESRRKVRGLLESSSSSVCGLDGFFFLSFNWKAFFTHKYNIYTLIPTLARLLHWIDRGRGLVGAEAKYLLLFCSIV
ncbi:hypothetical protein B0T26DRAFT_470415 [Lasiosphaeria miniovina]|uniref:Uncharacterized protein n=1 Tax=Lasiosphaeria miniovina TaxID=1954250 RepID=A0AA40DKN8_9PEZI|nr:uncharacterized protein B0T26DRAFT_470415 [Lasiosphaeria miniovina]KAK0706745.1 hypothetical protein B0T26DRAFT_470415 [Lasiosphaeria miniovina]